MTTQVEHLRVDVSTDEQMTWEIRAEVGRFVPISASCLIAIESSSQD